MIAYKYLHPNRTSVVEDGLIRFTQPFALNDPFETIPDMRRLERSFRELAIRMIDRENLSAINYGIARLKIEDRVATHLAEFQRMNNRDYAILSLSKTPNSLLMWAHYCDSHRGFVVGFDATHTFFSTRQFKRHSTLEEVHYSNERPVMPAPDEWDGSKEQIERELSNQDLAELLFYTKSEDWEYEQELRMIANPQVADRHVPVDGQDVYLYEFPPESLKELIFGIRMPRDKRRQLRDIVKGKYENAELFEAKLDPGRFDLEIARFQF